MPRMCCTCARTVPGEIARRSAIGFALKSKNCLGHSIFEHADVALLQRRQIAIVLVSCGDEKIG